MSNTGNAPRERRGSVRTTMTAIAYVKRPGEMKDGCRVTIIDISMSGLAFSTSGVHASFVMNEKVAVEIILDGASLTAEAMVARMNSRTIGLAFPTLTPALMRFISGMRNNVRVNAGR